jgi:LEA14-like dessication related protein
VSSSIAGVRAGMAGLMDKAKGFVADKIAHMPKPEASLDKVTFKGMTRDAITVHSHVNVTNPYSHRIPICDIAYVLKCGGKEVASGTIPDPGWIEDSGEITKLEVPAKVPYNVLITIIKDLGRDWDIDYELQVNLTIDLPIFGNITIPLKTAGEFKLPTLSDFFGGGDKEEEAAVAAAQ